MMKGYEENTKWTTFQSWFVVFLISGSLLGWAMIMMTFVKDAPREWDFGTLEYTPAKSIYSSADADIVTKEKMVAPLPEGVSMEEENQRLNHEAN